MSKTPIKIQDAEYNVVSTPPFWMFCMLAQQLSIGIPTGHRRTQPRFGASLQKLLREECEPNKFSPVYRQLHKTHRSEHPKRNRTSEESE